MKFILILIVIPFIVFAQPDNEQLLKIKSVSSVAQMNAISNPEEGCLVFVSATKVIYYYDNSSWKPLGNSWHINGNTCSSGNFLGTTNNQDISFRSNNTERMAIKNDGKIGVNTNSPTGVFQVGESTQSAEDIINTSNISTSPVLAPGYANFYVDNLNTQGAAQLNQSIQYNGSASDPRIVTQYTIRTTSFYPPNGFIFQGRLNDNSGWVTLNSQSNVSWPGSYYLEFNFNNTTVYEDYRLIINSITSSVLSTLITEVEFKEIIEVFPILTVKDNGRVGIGFDPPTQKLQVGGHILADAYTPDYVFEHYFEGQSELNPNYKSYSLEKTKKYIEKHKHLPGVPSAQEVKRQGGIILNKAIDTNLEKIEELYLHIFKLNTRIKELEHLISIEEIKKAPQK